MYNPIERSRYIEHEFKKYLKSTLRFDNESLNKLYEKDLGETEIFKGPYLSFNNPFKTSISIDNAIKNGDLSNLFYNLSDIDFNMKLYEHQYKSLKRLQHGKSIVITTGTGSGKTESFLYPILNDILKDIEENKDYNGIRAVFLYPVNALVNDQMQRLRNILKKYPKITFGSYTGDTFYTEKEVNIYDRNEKNKALNDDEYRLIDYPDNEIRSREEMREKPPMLLFTNYAMLEYILIRPSDQSLFIPENTQNWKFMVLDEAHRYQGALGIELSHLLRRLTGKYKKRRIQYILTSATLGKGKENINEIIDFAKNLTSSSFSASDIIFAERKVQYKDRLYRLRSKDYEFLLNKSDLNNVKTILKKYRLETSDNYNEMIYDILLYDENFQSLLDLIKNKEVLLFYEILEKLNTHYTFSENDLINLIDLISFASKDGIPLLVCKYHVFLRTPQGAFGVIKPYLDIKISRVKEIGEYKAYEIGACRFCSSIFLMGNIVESRKRFIQNDTVDIYENYGEDAKNKDLRKVDFLLVPPENTDLSENENMREYILCNKCGHLKRSLDKNAVDCECQEECKLKVFHIIDTSKVMSNNITRCPICENYSRGGVVRAFHIQKDEATSILSQINLKSMPVKDNEIKQFIAFSDSVQQASYYATFLEYNHKKFLRKKIILDVINEEEDGSISLRNLTGEIEEILKYDNLFDVHEDIDTIYKTEAWVTTLTELMRIDGQFSGEGLGLFAFKLKDLKAKKIERALRSGDYEYLSKLSTPEIIDLSNIAFETFRTTPAIEYKKHELNVDIIEEELLYRSFDNFVAKLDTVGNSKREKKNIRSFLPASTEKHKPRANKLIKFIYKVFDINDLNEATCIASEIWDLAEELKIFENSRGETENKKINVSKYEVVSGDSIQWYKCEKCHKLTPFNVKNKCPQKGCEGLLVKYYPDENDRSRTNYYIEQYKNKEIEKLIVEEHTAQIGKKLGRINQDLFRDQKINVLSSSTTFEMGIDIGSLDNVFLRNVPPTPANYAQRAGRAGRRLGNAGFILTYCGITSHDYTYFKEPEKMIKGIIKPPYFKVDNKKILFRHITAAALGMFFQDEDVYYETLGDWIDNNGLRDFISYLNKRPINLISYVNDSLLNNIDVYEYKDAKWIDYITNKTSEVHKMQNYVESEINNLEQAIEEAQNEKTSGGLKRARIFRYQIDRLKDTRLINALSSFVVIPKYGFPVDVVELEIPKYLKKDKDNSPSRDLSVAISEYAPESEVVINKKKFKSRYIKFPYQAFDKLEVREYYECDNCGGFIVDYDLSANYSICPYCGEEVDIQKIKNLIIPSYGFATETREEKTRMLKPKKTYASEIEYLGGGEENNDKLSITNKIFLESSKDDKFLSVNKTPFFVCNKCGFTKVEHKFGRSREFTDKKHHRDKYGRECNNLRLKQYSLAHIVKTDVVKLTINISMTTNEKLSVLYALLDSISTIFNIERRDINGVVTRSTETQFIFFDQVSGGAGHVKRMLNRRNLIDILNNAYTSMSYDCCDANTSCYSCLRNYGNQRIHDRLKRGFARDGIGLILSEINSNSSSNRVGFNPKINYKFYYGVNLDESLKNNIDYILNDYELTSKKSKKMVDILSRYNVDSSERMFYDNKLIYGSEEIYIDAVFPDKKVFIVFDCTKLDKRLMNVLENDGWISLSINE